MARWRMATLRMHEHIPLQARVFDLRRHQTLDFVRQIVAIKNKSGIIVAGIYEFLAGQFPQYEILYTATRYFLVGQCFEKVRMDARVRCHFVLLDSPPDPTQEILCN